MLTIVEQYPERALIEAQLVRGVAVSLLSERHGIEPRAC
jgi:hypothetical protein